MEVTFLRLTNFKSGFMGPDHADGSWGEGRLLSVPLLPSYSPPSVSATEICKGPNRFASGFFFFSPLCNILKFWKILWNNSVYRA